MEDAKQGDSKTLGHKNSILLEPYLRWMRCRSQSLKKPYLVVILVIVEPVVEGDVPHTILHLDTPTDFE